jgi:hypothetical protein
MQESGQTGPTFTQPIWSWPMHVIQQVCSLVILGRMMLHSLSHHPSLSRTRFGGSDWKGRDSCWNVSAGWINLTPLQPQTMHAPPCSTASQPHAKRVLVVRRAPTVSASSCHHSTQQRDNGRYEVRRRLRRREHTRTEGVLPRTCTGGASMHS